MVTQKKNLKSSAKAGRRATRAAGKKAAPKAARGKSAAVRKPAAKTAARPKPALKTAAVKKGIPARLPPPPPVKKVAAPSAKARPAKPFRKEELAYFRQRLQAQLELVQSNLNALASDNLKRSPIEATGDISAHSTHMADQGTDNFDRELALNLASGRQESLYDIEDALRRIDEGTYGVCEACGGAIERPRLKALPFAKKCLACQSAAERGRTKYRPFGSSVPLQQLITEESSETPETPG